MARRMSDDEIMDYTYNKLFGDLDRIESGSMYSPDEEATQGAAETAGTPGIEGVSIIVKPVMAGAQEGGKPDDIKGMPDEEEEEEDRLKGIGRISPLMAQLHGER